MKKVPACLLFIFLSVMISRAQKSNYLDGFIFTREGDTVPCSIAKRNWKKQPLEIRIKLTGKDSLVTPSGLKGFMIPSLQLVYISKEISPVKYIDNIQQASDIWEADTDTARFAFLKRIHNGVFNLYLFLDRLNRNHFFVEAPDNFLEIYSHYYTRYGGDHNSQPVAEPHKQYEFALKVLMTPCRQIFSIIESIQLKEEQLKGLFEVYDKCIAAKTQE